MNQETGWQFILPVIEKVGDEAGESAPRVPAKPQALFQMLFHRFVHLFALLSYKSWEPNFKKKKKLVRVEVNFSPPPVN